MAIYSGFSHWKWWFSKAILNYQGVREHFWTSWISSGYIWVNFITTSLRPHHKWWLVREIIPKWPEFRLVKYYNLPRYHGILLRNMNGDIRKMGTLQCQKRDAAAISSIFNGHLWHQWRLRKITGIAGPIPSGYVNSLLLYMAIESSWAFPLNMLIFHG